MPPKIVISHNCQTIGIACTLNAIFPEWIIRSMALPAVNDESKIKQLEDELSSAQFWITSGHFDLAKKFSVRMLKAPGIDFFAFHPDLRYAKINSTGAFTKFHYNSQIAVWAYNNRIGVEQAKRLFNERIFASLGYFDEWENSLNNLLNIFIENDIPKSEFLKFFAKIKRHGIFMHSINHPLAVVLTELTKILANRICRSVGLDYSERIFRTIIIPDLLTDQIWPVYPEIANALGVEGSYCWRIERQEIYGLDNYLKHTFKSYRDQNLNPGDLQIMASHRELDQILGNQL